MVVDLWASWCGPCRTLGPILEKVVDETGGDVELVKVDVDANPRVAATFQVQSIPAVFAIKDRKVVDSFVGALPEPAVRQWSSRLSAGRRARSSKLVGRGRRGVLRRRSRSSRATRRPCSAWPRLLVDKGDAAAKRGPGPARPHPRDGRGPPHRRRGPRRRPGRGRRSTGSRPSSTTCSTGSRATRRPGRSSSTCSRCSARRSPHRQYRKALTARLF